MKIIALEVVSLDGKSTKWTEKNIYEWSSPEDFAHFVNVRSQHNLLLTSSETFNAVKDITHVGLKAEEERLRIIMTRTPERYKQYEVPGQLEFVSGSPSKIVSILENRGYKNMLFCGGSKLLASFLKEKLIDEIWLTLEPRIFGTGHSLVAEEKFDVKLQLLESKQLNAKGTFLLKYKVEK